MGRGSNQIFPNVFWGSWIDHKWSQFQKCRLKFVFSDFSRISKSERGKEYLRGPEAAPCKIRRCVTFSISYANMAVIFPSNALFFFLSWTLFCRRQNPDDQGFGMTNRYAPGEASLEGCQWRCRTKCKGTLPRPYIGHRMSRRISPVGDAWAGNTGDNEVGRLIRVM